MPPVIINCRDHVGLVMDPAESWFICLGGPASPAGIPPEWAWDSLSVLLGTVAVQVGPDLRHQLGDVEVWLSAAATERLGFPSKEPAVSATDKKADLSWTESSPVLAAARDAGWSVNGNGLRLTVCRQGGRTTHVSLAGWADPAEHQIVAGADGLHELADRLSWWAEQEMGEGTLTPYRRKPDGVAIDNEDQIGGGTPIFVQQETACALCREPLFTTKPEQTAHPCCVYWADTLTKGRACPSCAASRTARRRNRGTR